MTAEGVDEAATVAAAAEIVALHRDLVARGESPAQAQRSVLRHAVTRLASAWDRVHPALLGTIYERCLADPERHAHGVHFTGEQDIARVIGPTITAPWSRRLAAAETTAQLRALHAELCAFTVLDPACGSGNFLYAAFMALRRIEAELLARQGADGAATRVRASQCRGIDRSPLAAELARVTLEVADRRAGNHNPAIDVAVGDALFMPWGRVDAIVGNPPFVAKNKRAPALGRAYVDRLRAAYPEVSGRADYCVYFFRRAHDALAEGGRAGMIGTNTIRQNDSRAGGLDYIVANGGRITDAIASCVWPGEALVHVAVVNWLKGETEEPRVLARQLGDGPAGPWVRETVPSIAASLSALDLTRAEDLACNLRPKRVFQGQTHGCKGFLLNAAEAAALARDDGARRWLFPYMIGEDLLGAGRPRRYAMDLSEVEDLRSIECPGLIRRLAAEVLPEVRRKAAERPGDGARRAHLATWWRFWRPRQDLVERLRAMSRYVACVRVTRRPIFAFVDAGIRPNDALQVFTFADDYSFGVLQSQMHGQWFMERCSTLKADYRYTSETVWSSFPWPQAPTRASVARVAEAARAVRAARVTCVAVAGSLRAVYRALAEPQQQDLRDCHDSLDRAVRGAYGMPERVDAPAYLLDLNRAIAADERAGRRVQAPGLPEALRGEAGLHSGDRLECPAPWADDRSVPMNG